MNEFQVKELLEKKGYKLDKIFRFKRHDRINYSNKDVDVSLNLTVKLEDLTEEQLDRVVV